ncbi:hypothetical protein BD779DRAFT_1540244 [Infundibulicybe gibba]|nr:hypothetical protein BD779DRAFT_1540244 [Infundibulicybe gibba]
MGGMTQVTSYLKILMRSDQIKLAGRRISSGVYISILKLVNRTLVSWLEVWKVCGCCCPRSCPAALRSIVIGSFAPYHDLWLVGCPVTSGIYGARMLITNG